MSDRAEPLGDRHLAAFFLTIFAITWGLGRLYFLFPDAIVRLSGPVHVNHPLFMLATYAPAIAAVSVIATSRGRPGLRAWARHRFVFRLHWGWYVVVVGGIAASSFAEKPTYAATWIALCLVLAVVLVWRLGPRNLGAARYVDPLSSETA